MEKAGVYFISVHDGEELSSIAGKAVRLAQAAGFADVIVSGRPCAVKQHFGEDENTGYIKPEITRAVADWVRNAGGKAFVTDTNTLYRGRRQQAVDHLDLASEHGFTHENLGAPVIIADGLLGTDQVTVPIRGGKYFREVRLATAGYQASSCIVLTHAKGHCLSGLGGAVKNVGMGFAARAGKLAQHCQGYPDFEKSKCRACRTCAKWCPAGAIVIEKRAAGLIQDKCIGCGECLAICPHGAIRFKWNVEGPALIEKMCEQVLGFLSNKQGRMGYLNFLIDVTKDCDCLGHKQKTQYPNVGIFASTDILAVDKATADISVERYGKDIWLDWWPGSNYRAQFVYGAKLGIGTARYELVEIK